MSEIQFFLITSVSEAHERRLLMIQSLIDDAVELFGGMSAGQIAKEVIPVVGAFLMMYAIAILLL